MMEKNIDEFYMKIAIEEAVKGVGETSPNPLVGAVIVKNNEIIGKGFHEKYGENHAEVNAIKNVYEKGYCTKSATIYVTLEPCSHYGNTPPCVNAIIEAGISRVVIASNDPNPKVDGINFLRENGICVTENVLKEKADAINVSFFHYIKHKMPFILMKYAMTLDGKIATKTGDSKYITGPDSLAHVHLLRGKYTAIMVGVNTVLADDPQLTCRAENGRNPIRIIMDTTLRTPISAKVVREGTIIVTESNETSAFEEKGVKIIKADTRNIKEVLAKLGEIKIDSILLEGGATLNYSFIEVGCVNKIYAYISPKIFGGKEAFTPVAGLGVSKIAEALKLENLKIKQLGHDILVEGDVCLQE
ncbi:MAG: bifunctional diaminohydroxyphosphoribosylaminopyrimidine deaminase/5-amino-6-(5-phosphoribosylamino)uracil reductase RibD [Defluviitaleaceae bacterium]|nr:bifunctional diaminohydroxyphosphoribosylaminopyrimidine deaminase/5-amino-6-(5-phosphoribosylamino)uracil reductase RibD [Defluviitaleaceae bacterium]